MKRILLSVLLTVNCFKAISQCNCTLPQSNGSILTENYNNAGNWVFTNNTQGSMSITGGTMFYNFPPGDNFNKASLAVPGLVANSQSFVAEASVAINPGGNSPGHFIMAFTANAADPLSDQNNNATNNDGIFVSLLKEGGVPSSNTCCTIPNAPNNRWQFNLNYKDGFNFNFTTQNNVINMDPINPFATYYVRLVRINCFAYMAVYSDPTFTTHIQGSPVCISIPNTVTNFGVLQQGVHTWAHQFRTVNMNVDNVMVSPYIGGCDLLGISFIQPNACAGEDVTITVTGAQANSSYLWSTGETTQTITVNPQVNTTYTVTVTTPEGCTTQVSQNIKVYPLPIATLGSNQTVCSPINLCTPYDPTYTYQWLTPGGCLYGNNCAQTCQSGNYCVTVTNTFGCSATDCADITVSSAPTGTLTYSPNNPCPGDSVNLGVLTACNNCTYQWSTGANTAGITVNPLVSTTYTVTITNTYGCSTVLTQLVTVDTNCLSVQFCRYIPDGFNGKPTRDRGESVIKTADGGIAMVGTLWQTVLDNDIYFVKYASDMTPQCSLRLGDLISGGFTSEYGFTVMEASDGIFYVAGTVVSGSGTDVMVVKLDLHNCATNPIVWSRTYGQSIYSESVAKMIEMPTASNNYQILLVGSATSTASTTYDMFALKIDNAGNYIDSRVYYPYGGNTTREFAHDVIRLSSNKYIIVGESIGGQTDNVLVLNISSDLTLTASALIDGGKNENAYGVVARGADIFVTGSTSNFNPPNRDVLVLKMNSSLFGVITGYIYRSYNNASQETGYSIKLTDSDRLIIAGSCSTSATTNKDGLLLNINPLNMTSGFWAKRSAQSGYYLYNDEFFDVAEIQTGNFVVTGYTGLTSTEEEIFIGKFDYLSSGTSECCLVNYPIQVSTYAPSVVIIDQKDITLTSTSQGVHRYYYNELYTCSQSSSFRMKGEKEMQNSDSPQGEVRIYPNPTTGVFRLMTSNLWNGAVKIQIFDASGRLVLLNKTFEKSTNEIELNAGNLKEGIYFVEVTTDSEKYRSKIAIQK